MPKNRKIPQIKPKSKKHLGQHLMHNKRLIKKVISLANIKPHEFVVEIGAGLGAVTLPLTERAGYVLAIGKDPTFVRKLQCKTKQIKNMKIVQQDFLKFTLPSQPYCVVSNIPYAITTPILKKLLNFPANPFDRAVLVIEKGAAKRFTEKRTTNPQILTWRICFDLTIGQTILPENFSPPPRVDSAMLLINRKQKPLIASAQHKHFKALASYALRHSQLQIREALQGIFTSPQITRLLRNLKVDHHATIGSLDEQQWASVFQTMIQYVERYRWPKFGKKKY